MSKKLIYPILFVAVLGLAEAQAQDLDRAAYWDADYPFAWGGDGVAMRDALDAAGYMILDADELKTWMDARIADGKTSVVVFCRDIVPETVAETMDTNCTLRKYLDAGGKVVWWADWPFYYVGHPDGSMTTWGSGGASAILGFNASSGPNDSYDEVVFTLAGITWGLTETWQSRRPTSATITTDLTVLATISSGSAAAWVKHYVPGDKGRGFVRLFDTNGQANPDDVMRVAEYLALKAMNPDPPDGATGVTSPLLTWEAGTGAKFHDVYLGTNPTPGAAEYKGRQVLAWNMWYEVAGWTPGRTYYWRIDEVEADGTTIHTGDVWSFVAAPFEAYDPDPPDGARYVSTDADISWAAGMTATSHDVYFGTDEASVTDGTGGTFKGNQPEVIYEPGTLAKGTTYYWRIDEVEQDTTTKHTGHVWNFTTIPDIPIADPDLVGWWKLDEGEGIVALDWSGHDHHGTFVGEPQWVAGYDGGGLEFDGDDHVDCGNDASLDVTAPITIMIWARPSTAGETHSTNPGVIAKAESGVGWSWQLRYKAVGTPGYMGFQFNPVSGSRVWAHVGQNLAVGEWHHVAGVVDGTNAICYLNGEETDRKPLVDFQSSNAKLFIGYEGWIPWYGAADDARIYSRALTQEKIKQAMRGDPLIAWNPRPANGSVPNIDEAATLTWSPGDEAAKHDVYFGTDVDAVTDADTTTTGIYRGRIDPNSYTPPEGVEFAQSYFWRIDEFNNDATISEGRIWSFAVANYLTVDDFESYDDYCNRIFYTWPDGWGHNGDAACGVPAFGGNGTGSTVGYLQEPYAEQTITHAGSFQSMPMEYLNDGSTGKALYSETMRTFDPPQDWTRHGVKALALWFRGNPGTMSSFTGPDPYTMTAGGGDIWGTADHFHFAWKNFSGQGSIVTRIDGLQGENPHVWAKAGVMIRETLDANSVQAMVIVTPTNRVQFARRTAVGATSDSTHTDVDTITLPHWVKLTRQANMFTAQHSTDGVNWQSVGDPTSVDIVMGSNVYIGLVLTSQQDAARIPITAVFSNVNITGSVSGQWQSEDIGLTYNAAEPLYVAVEDNTGKSEVVNHPVDPNAVLSDTWQEWNIDLQQVADAGVDLQSVNKMYIGVGDRDAPELGGGGMLYIDDIRLYRPRCVPSLLKPDADFDDNCMVNYLDVEIMANEWLIDANDLQADLDLDNDVDFKDYAGLANMWLDVLLWPWP